MVLRCWKLACFMGLDALCVPRVQPIRGWYNFVTVVIRPAFYLLSLIIPNQWDFSIQPLADCLFLRGNGHFSAVLHSLWGLSSPHQGIEPSPMNESMESKNHWPARKFPFFWHY